MRWPWQRRKQPEPEPERRIAQRRHVSPLDADVLKRGDEGWKIWEEIQRTGGPVIGTYDPADGRIVSMRSLEHEDED